MSNAIKTVDMSICYLCIAAGTEIFSVAFEI